MWSGDGLGAVTMREQLARLAVGAKLVATAFSQDAGGPRIEYIELLRLCLRHSCADYQPYVLQRTSVQEGTLQIEICQFLIKEKAPTMWSTSVWVLVL